MFLLSFWYFRYKITKNFKNLKTFAHFFANLHIPAKSSTFALAMAKRVAYISPVDYMSGSVSGRQLMTFGESGVDAYETTEPTLANAYRAKLVLRYHTRKRLRCFQVRTQYTANVTDKSRLNLATMGGAGAIYAAIVRERGVLYNKCVAAAPKGMTLRSFVIPILRAGLSGKVETIRIAEGVTVNNPWISGTQSVPVPQSVLDKFAPVLSNN